MTIVYARGTVTHHFHGTHFKLIDSDGARSSGIDAFGSACDDVTLQPIVIPRAFDDGGWARTTKHGVAVSP